MDASESRIALYLDFENLAIGAREDLGGHKFNFKPIADALAERGRVIARRAYADWNMFEEFRRDLVTHQVELIEIPQRMGNTARKNAADIKMAVDALEMAFEREYVTTFVIATGDSDFTPLVHKLRELNKRVVGIGLKDSTSALLPPACDEFLFYENLDGLDLPTTSSRRRNGRRRGGRGQDQPQVQPEVEPATTADLVDLEQIVTQTLSGLQRTSDGVVLSSSLKRALLRKDPTFSEADYGFRAFGELLSTLGAREIIDISEGPARGDPEISFPEDGGQEEAAFELLGRVVAEVGKGDPVPLSGMKDQMRKVDSSFSEKAFGFGGFLQFSKAAAARRFVSMEWDDEAEDYLLTP
ncbi:NYN domain-containing protein [bacterium]|nr:NYN domain-containing protein [bacterium]